MRQLLAALIIAAVLAPQVAAQSLSPGERVRVTHPGEGRRIGTVVAVTPDTLEVRWTGSSTSTRLPLAQVSRLDVSRGLQRRSRLTQTGAGFLVGAGVGGVLGAVAGSDCSSSAIACPGAAGGALIIGVLLGATGALVGAVIPPGSSEAWERVSRERSRIAIVAPPGGGKGAGIAIAF